MSGRLTGKLAYFSTWFGFKLGCSFVRVFPGAAFRLADSLASLAYVSFRRYRSRTTASIRAALGKELEAAAIDVIGRHCLRNFFRSCVEIAIALGISDEQFRAWIPVIGRENIDRALAKGRGVIVLSAHLGNFFLLGSRLAVEGLPTYVLVNQPRDGKFAAMMDAYRLRVRQRTIHARPRQLAFKELRETLAKNHAVVVIADEYRRGSGVEVSLFGRTVIARRGPATLAMRTGAPIVPARLVRQPDNSLQLIIEPELELERAAKRKNQIKDNTIRITRWVERTVRAYPDQWNWMNLRWWKPQSAEAADVKASAVIQAIPLEQAERGVK
jgi:KDO2-lipid IV(A) lauroyltransferase